MVSEQVLPELIMSAKRSVWRMHDHADDADKAFKSIRAAVLESAEDSCKFCGHKSTKFQEVHHIDDDHKNNALTNLVCSCPLCHQVFHIGLAGLKEGAEIIYAPEFTQAELNQLSLIIWLVNETKADSFKDPAQSVAFARISGRAKTLEAQIMNRRGTVMMRLRTALVKTSFPAEFINEIKLSHLTPTLFATALMALPDERYADREDLLGGLRLLPIPTRFAERIKHWNTEQSAVLPISAWFRIITDDAIAGIVAECAARLAEASSASGQG